MHPRGLSFWFFLCRCRFLAFVILPVGAAIAEDRLEPSPGRWVVVGAGSECVNRVTRTLGTLQPTPYIMVRGNWPAGGGYSPLEVFGDQSIATYGPLSPLRNLRASDDLQSRI